MRPPLLRLSLLMILSLAACGGGGGGGNGAVVPSASLSTLAGDPLSAPADDTTEVLLSVTVRDERGTPMANLPVTLDATGTGLSLTASTVTTDAAGLATAKLRAAAAGSARVAAIADPGKADVRLSTEVQIEFTPLGAPVVQGAARFVDVDRDGAAGAGDRLVVPFSTAVTVAGATAADFVLPVTGDALGSGATVAGGPSDSEVTITLGSAPRLRTRGRFAAAAVTANEPSGIDVVATNAIRNAVTGAPAVASAPLDVVPAPIAAVAVAGPAVALVTGNFDADAAPDVLVADATSLAVLRGDGFLGFTAATPVATPAPIAVLAAELNNFPVTEAATVHTNGVQIWNNSVVAPQVEPNLEPGAFLAVPGATCAAFADVNGDAFPDVLVGSAVGIVVFLHQRNLGNSFAQETTLAVGAVTSLAIGDLDGDGDEDVVFGIASSGGAAGTMKNQNGTLGPAQQLTAVEPRAVATGDVDGDGRDEVVVTGPDDVQVFDAESIFAPGVALPLTARSATVVDVDRDAFGDLAVVFADRVELWLADRVGGFVPSVVLPVAGGRAVAVADFDGDADADLAVLGDDVTVFAGSSAGTFGSTTFVADAQLAAGELAAMAFGDVDGDDRLDRLVGKAGGVEVQLGDGVGGFAPAGQFATATPTALALGDLDGDGDLDAVLGFDGTNEVYANTAGAFSLATSLAPGSTTLCLALLDYDGDGDLDVVFGNDGANQVFTNVTTTTLAFTEDTDVFAALAPNVAAGTTIALLPHDVDREGDVDLLVVNGGTEAAPQDSFLLKFTALPTPRFTLNQTYTAQLLATAAVLGDRDGDGRLDLALARRSATGNATLQVHRGQRTNLNTLPENVPGTPDVTIRAFALDDVDGDGRSDLVLANDGTASEVWLQSPNGSFALVQSLDLLAPVALFTEDLDRDGDLDLVTLETAGPSRVFRNR